MHKHAKPAIQALDSRAVNVHIAQAILTFQDKTVYVLNNTLFLFIISKLVQQTARPVQAVHSV